jgi:hypothetical protein
LARCGYPPIIFEANTDDWYAKEKEELFAHLGSMEYQIAEIRPFNNMFVAVPKNSNVQIKHK